MDFPSFFAKQQEKGKRVYLQSRQDAQYYYQSSLDGSLIPNTKVYIGKKLTYNINSLGCIGPEIDPNLPTIGFFGDSTTFCSGDDSWVRRIKLPGFQILNAGAEGLSMEPVVDKLNGLARRINLVGAVVYTGWHNTFYGKNGEEFWRSELDLISDLPFIAHVNIATSVTEEAVERGVEELMNRRTEENSSAYGHWGTWRLTKENLRILLDGVNKFNKFIKSYALEKDRPVIDLANFLRVKNYDDIPNWFCDPGHMRVNTYPKIAKMMTEKLSKLLPPSEYLIRKPTIDQDDVAEPARTRRNVCKIASPTGSRESAAKDKEIEAKNLHIQNLLEVIEMQKRLYASTLQQLVDVTCSQNSSTDHNLI
ncbi:MAG: hypothetical protein VX617_05450 [Pseudomonadota bacterium]|nr:hypothetical protein [Pseudomonadota bacterium]